jgi:hypothetical protein
VIALNRNWINSLGAISWCKLYTGSVDQVIALFEATYFAGLRKLGVAEQ